jgi:hypothetical protein
VLVLHIPEGVIAFEQLILASSTITVMRYAEGKLPFSICQLCTFQQRHYRPDNQLT